MKDLLKVINSKAYPLYLLHNDLTRKTWRRELPAKRPETRRATQKQLNERTRLCSKIVRRLLGSGEKPIEPGDSWLSKIEF